MSLKLIAGALALVASAAVNAANFDFTGSSRPNDGRYTQLSFSAGGIGLTVTPAGNSTRVTAYWEGLGAYSRGADLNTFDDCCSVSGQNADELVFTFDSMVTLGGISFRQWENSSDRVRFIGGGQDFILGNSGQGLFDLVDYFTFDTPITLQSFTLRAVNGAGTATYIHGLQNVEAIPLPAAAWLMGSALLGLAGAARRRGEN